MIEAARPVDEATSKNLALNISWPWSYDIAESNRDLRLDFLRGLCFFVMTVNHISDFAPQTWINAATGHGEFFITAAEGFVFISGLVMGMVYVKIIKKEGIGKALGKAVNRLGKIYLVTVGMTLFFVSLATFTPFKLWALREWITVKDPIELIVGSFTMHFAYHGSSIMVMFVLFLVIAPAALYALSLGKVWWVLGLSWLVWVANVFYPSQFTIPFQSNFPFAAWQTIFFTGMVIGYYRNEIPKYFKQPWINIYKVVVTVLAVAMVVLFITYRDGSIQQSFLGNINFKPFMDAANDKGNLPVERMFGIFLYLQFFYLLVGWFWVPLKKVSGWFFLTLGEAGMYVFIMHLVVVDIVYNIPGATGLGDFWFGLVEIAAVGLLWIMVKTHFLFKIIPR
ncbi:MAG TPA: OpgC domain-containing protein [Chloroflexia bacterium]|nr:OpgC domain-containing protein [Chloroflexia bacterium]